MPSYPLTDEITLHYEDQGSGRPVLFLHGVWMSSRFFQKQLPSLSRRFRALALDFRGHGRSTHIHRGHTMAQYARDVRSFIQGLGLKDVVLVGWSMGAFVLWEYAKQFGTEGVAGSVVIDESASDFKWPDWPLGIADLPGLSHLMSAVQTDRPAFIRDFIPLMFKDTPAEDDARWMFDEITSMPESIASAVLFDQTVQDYRPGLAAVSWPTLLCFGRDEKLVPIAAGEHLARSLPNARLSIFEQSSHCPFLEEPERFNEELDQFVAALP